MTENKKSKIKIRHVILVAFGIYVLFHVVQNVKYRTGPAAEVAKVTDKIEELTNENGYTNAQEKLKAENIQKLSQTSGDKQLMTAIGGFIGLEYRLSDGYANFCKKQGLKEMPNQRKNVETKNKKTHDKAIALLNKMAPGSSAEFITALSNTMAPQLEKVIEMEFDEIKNETGKNFKEICEAMEKDADNNELLFIESQRPDVVKIIEDAPL